MRIYEALKKDHDKVKGLLADLIDGENDEKACKVLVSQIRDELIPHSRAEEAVFYNSLREIAQSRKIAMHGYTEHLEAETLLRALQAVEGFGAKGLGLAKKLQHSLQHHIAEEEGEIFAAAKQLFLDQEAEQMGEAFEKMKPGIKKESIIGTTWEMVVNLMPERLRNGFRKTQESRISP